MVSAAILQMFIDVGPGVAAAAGPHYSLVRGSQNRRSNTFPTKRTIPVGSASQKKNCSMIQARHTRLLAATYGQGPWIPGSAQHEFYFLGLGTVTLLAEIRILPFPWRSPGMDLSDQYFQTQSPRFRILVLLGHVPMRAVIKPTPPDYMSLLICGSVVVRSWWFRVLNILEGRIEVRAV